MTKLAFFGSDQYSTIVLAQLVQSSKFTISAVITDLGKDNPVELFAKEHHLSLIDYSTLPKNSQPLGIVASFGHILPSSVIQLFPKGILCLHPSLLPKYRGATPVPYALAMGDKTTGITLFRLTAKIDQGEILAQLEEPILPTDTSPVLLTRLFALGFQLLLDYLPPLPMNRSIDQSIHQNISQPLIFTKRFTKESGHFEWPVIKKLLANQPVLATETNNSLLELRLKHHPQGNILSDFTRALTPWPTVWTIAETKKGKLRISLVPYSIPYTKYAILIPGKPNPIMYTDFVKYYLE